MILDNPNPTEAERSVALRILDAAKADLVENGWVQRKYQEGKVGVSDLPDALLHADITVGRALRTESENPVALVRSYTVVGRASALVWDVICGWITDEDIRRWNDMSGRTVDDVHQVLDIAKAKIETWEGTDNDV